MRYTLKVNTSEGFNLRVRSEPHKSKGKELGSLPNGDKIIATQESGGWYYIEGLNGWVDGSLVKIIDTGKKSKETTKENKSKGTEKKKSKKKAQVKNDSTLEYKVSSYSNVDSALAKKMMVTTMTGIHGMPYQFMGVVDQRVKGTKFGRKYAEKIVSRMPLVFFQPCKPIFMPKFDSKEKAAVLDALKDVNIGKKMLDGILDRSGKFYNTEFAYAEYYQYVNPLCNACATLMGLKNQTFTAGTYTSKLGTFDWSKALNPATKQYFSCKESVAFYIDSDSSIQESFSNQTADSSLASKVNSISDLAREVTFLLGAEAGVDIQRLTQDKYDTTQKEINNLINKYANSNNILKNVASQFTTVATGGKLIFPEIWADSDFSRSYNISIKLRSPDCDKFSIFLNIIVPYIHLMCLALPRQYGNNGYKSPFLCRVFYKGMYNIDCGLITSMSTTRGKEGSWSADGLATEMDVNLEVKDLYSAMSISNNKKIMQLAGNTAMMDYLMNMCGINVFAPGLNKIVEYVAMLGASKIKNFPNTLWSAFEQSAGNMILELKHKYLF